MEHFKDNSGCSGPKKSEIFWNNSRKVQYVFAGAITFNSRCQNVFQIYYIEIYIVFTLAHSVYMYDWLIAKVLLNILFGIFFSWSQNML